MYFQCKWLSLLLLLSQCVSQELPHELGLYNMHGYDENSSPQNLRFHPHHGHEGPVQYAGLPRGLSAVPVPLMNADHELMFNISWVPSMGNPARDYSLEVRSETRTTDCNTPMCYEYNIPGAASWWAVPQTASPVAGGCSVRPGCSYSVRLIAHPWDGHTAANVYVELDECVVDIPMFLRARLSPAHSARPNNHTVNYGRTIQCVVGVCSCAYAPRLPAPLVQATTLSIEREIFVNVSWTLPPPSHPQRLPPELAKRAYFISIGKQMVSDAHPAPWFAHTMTKKIDTEGPVSSGDGLKWLLLPLSMSGERSVEKSGRRVKLDVKLLARVSLLDERECLGPPGNATAYDPVKTRKSYLMSYLFWAALGGACALAMVAAIALGTRSVKKVLNALRPAPATAAAPLEPLRRRPAWLPLQLFQNEAPRENQFEQSPLYVQKEYEEKAGDEWEVSRTRVHLGALIGAGAFGQVHAAKLDMPGGETMVVAAKMLSENATEEEIQDFLGEIAMLKHVGSHKHVIRLIGCCTQRVPLIALLEHAPRGDLLTLLRAARGRRRGRQGSDVITSQFEGRPSEADTEYTTISDSDPSVTEGKLSNDSSAISSRDHYVAEPALRLDSSTMREFALQVALGMRHLEQRGITHRDLAARNILVDGVGTLKVADFGLSRSGIYVHTRSRPVPLRWLAPEAILHAQYCSKSDVWAFAVLLWEIATLGGFPYAELSNHQVPAFLSGGCRLPKPARASPRLYQLMEECWSERAEDRPTFSSIVDKLQVQQQLYIDLDCVFPPSEEELAGLSDYDLSESER